MQLPTLTVTRDQAREEVARYREARKHLVLTREDERMLAAYRAIAKGKTVIDLHRALALGGTERHAAPRKTVDLPRLAVMRADKRWAWCDGIGRDGTVTFRDIGDPRSDVGLTRYQAVELFPRDDSRQTMSVWCDRATWRALVPTIPPHLRPTRPLHGDRVPIDLKGYVILWEAEWQLDKTVPPGDPALLRRLGGTLADRTLPRVRLYTVEAQWDLTPVEQAVLAGPPADATGDLMAGVSDRSGSGCVRAARAEPLIGTLAFSGYEFLCICCGERVTFFGPRRGDGDDPRLLERLAELEALWKENVGDRLLPSGRFWQDDCPKCRSDEDHWQHITDEELAADVTAREWLRDKMETRDAH
jgi:hypothetical protein